MALSRALGLASWLGIAARVTQAVAPAGQPQVPLLKPADGRGGI